MDVVTGAFGYIGKYIAQALLKEGGEVRTITTHPGKPNPFGPAVKAYPYHFENPRQLTETLAGAGVKKALSFNSRGRSSGVAVAEFQMPSKPRREAGVVA